MGEDHRDGPHHMHGPHHADGPHGHHHHHGGQGGGDHGQRGPEGTEFLELEMSQVLHHESLGLARDAVRELLREAIRDRLRERLGGRLRAAAIIVADELCDDFEANLGVEASIEERKQSRRDLHDKVRQALAAPKAQKAQKAPRR